MSSIIKNIHVQRLFYGVLGIGAVVLIGTGMGTSIGAKIVLFLIALIVIYIVGEGVRLVIEDIQYNRQKNKLRKEG